PERQRVPGFLLCQRWIGVQDPKVSVATYDLDAIGVVQSSGYRAIGGDNLSPWSKRVTSRVERLMRFEGDQVLPGDGLPPDNAGGFLVNAMNVEPAAEAEFNEWYNTEHIPALAGVPGVLCARRFRATSANRRYVALYHLLSLAGALLALVWRRVGLSIVVAASLCLYLLATPAFSSWLARRVEAELPENPDFGSAQAIVVVGGDVRLGDNGKPDTLGPNSLERLLFTAQAFRRLRLPVAVSGGPAEGSQQPAGDLMKTVLER